MHSSVGRLTQTVQSDVATKQWHMGIQQSGHELSFTTVTALYTSLSQAVAMYKKHGNDT